MSGMGAQAEVNLGGVTSVKFAYVEDVASCPEVMSDDLYVAAESIVLKVGKSWTKMPLTVDGAQYTDTPNMGANGELREHRLWSEIGGDDEVKGAAYNAQKYREVIVQFRDGNGNERLMGSLRNPARFSYSQQTGDVHGDAKRGWRFYVTDQDPLLYLE